jgi:hypothetical protein
LLTLLAAGAPGSSRNYAIEAGLGLAIAAGLAFAWLYQHPWHWSAAARLLLIGLLGWQAVTFWVLPERAYGRRPPTSQATAGRQNLLRFLTSTSHGPVLSEDPGLLLQAELPIEYYDPSLMQKLADAGVWDETLLVEQLQQRHFSVILTEVDLEREPERAGRWTAATVAAIRQHYRLLYRDVLMVWVPREQGGT